MSRNQEGITLIEVLAAVTILSIIGVIIWNVFFQGFNFSQQSMRKSKVQQEANLIVTSLTKFHQTSETYQINVTDCKITVSNSFKTNEFEHPQLCISSNFTGVKTVDPNKENFKLTITVSDKNNSNNQVSIDTVLYRLKSGG